MKDIILSSSKFKEIYIKNNKNLITIDGLNNSKTETLYIEDNKNLKVFQNSVCLNIEEIRISGNANLEKLSCNFGSESSVRSIAIGEGKLGDEIINLFQNTKFTDLEEFSIGKIDVERIPSSLIESGIQNLTYYETMLKEIPEFFPKIGSLTYVDFTRSCIETSEFRLFHEVFTELELIENISPSVDRYVPGAQCE